MSIFSLGRRFRSTQRLRHIVAVLVVHGFGHLVESINLGQHLPFGRRVKAPTDPHEQHTAPMRLRKVLEELGPTFVKMGQMLSGRPDLLPPAWTRELGKLRDNVAPFPAEAARKIIETELKAPISSLFTSFSETPLASGSIAQVHEAVIDGHTEVVVKVRRPDIGKLIAMDIDLLYDIAELLERHVPEIRIFRPKVLVEEFERTIHREMDFITEASYTTRFHELHADNPQLLTPEVYWDLTTPAVLTLSRITGTPLTRLDALREKGHSLPRLARIGADAYMKQFFEAGMFHADPHGGNVIVLDDGRVGIIDFGMVGHLSDEIRSQLATAVLAFIFGDVPLMVDVYSEIGFFSDVQDQEALRADLKELLSRYQGLPIKRIRTGDLFNELMALARRYNVWVPREYVLLARAFVGIEAIARDLDPDFNVTAVIKPYATLLMKEKASPERIFRSGLINTWQFTRLLKHAPQFLRRLSKKLLAGNLSIALHHEGLQSFTLELERSSNRLAFSVILAAIIVASSLIINARVGPAWKDISLLGVAGYLLAGLLGIWLVIAILRSGRL